MRIALLSLVLCAVGCGGSNDQPAQNPSNLDTTPTLTGAPANAPAGSTNNPTSTGTMNGSPSDTSTTNTMQNPPTPGVTSTPGTSPATASDSSMGAASGTHAMDADNTKNNDRDRHGTMTPMSQGNSRDETKLTAAVRRAVMADKSLSATAKNVKIITVGTKVTLRGAVMSDQEKSAIETDARQTAGVTDIDNQIDVKK